MRQGTTPTHYFDLDISTEMLAAARVTYKQGATIVLEKELCDCALTGNTVEVTLTQEETLKFDCSKVCRVQLHCTTLGGQALASDVFTLEVDELLSRRVCDASGS